MSTGSIEPSPSPSPGSAGSQPGAVTIPNGAPKFGTLVPNRVFVGGISSNTTESELHQLFSAFGNVKQTKIIADRAGVSKGYGFVTFETEEEARRLQQAEADNIMLKERKLNIAPAIKKQQPFGRQYEMGQPLVNGALYYHNGVPYTYQNASGTPTTAFPMIYPGPATPAVYLPNQAAASAAAQAAQAAAAVTQQQFQFQTAAAAAAAINNAAAAQQNQVNQSPSSGGSTPGSGVPNPAAAAGWRWITPQTTTGSAAASSCHSQQTAVAAGANHANPATPQIATQTFNYAQASSPNPVLLTVPSNPSASFPPATPASGEISMLSSSSTPSATCMTSAADMSQPAFTFPQPAPPGGATPNMTLVTPAHMMPGPPLAPPVVVKQPKLMEGVFVLDPTANNTDDERMSVSGQDSLTSPQVAPSRRLSFTSNNNNIKNPSGAKKILEKSKRDGGGGGCHGGCFVCPQPEMDTPPPFTPVPPQCEMADAPPPATPQEPAAQFVYPGYNNVLQPLTPITPSVDPAMGFKTGYIVPQTPNTMTPQQFQYYYFQASPACTPQFSPYMDQGYSYGAADAGGPGGYPCYPPMDVGQVAAVYQPMSVCDTVQLAEPPARKPGQDENDENTACTSLKQQACGGKAGNDPNTSYFTSPFKRFTRFSGTPSPNRFPMRSPSYRPARPNKGKSGQDGVNKANWYKAGARFGQRRSSKEICDGVAMSSPPGEVTPTRAAPPRGCPTLTPPPTPISAAEPDVMAGKLRKISIS